MKTYTVKCEWDDAGWWVVTVPGIPGAITQSRRLDQVEADVGEVIELMIGEAATGFAVELDWSVPGEAGETARRAAELRGQVEELSDSLEATSVDAVRRLRADGFSYRDIGSMLGMSYQRAQQIATDKISA